MQLTFSKEISIIGVKKREDGRLLEKGWKGEILVFQIKWEDFCVNMEYKSMVSIFTINVFLFKTVARKT